MICKGRAKKYVIGNFLQLGNTHTPTCKTCELGISVHAYPNGDI